MNNPDVDHAGTTSPVCDARHRNYWVFFLLLYAIAFAIYGGYIANDWVYDDHRLIVASDWYERPMQPGDLLADLGEPLCGRKMSYWRPGQLLLYKLQYTIFGENPAGWRFFAILLHATVGCLAMSVFRRFVKDPKLAFAAAALYLAHPAHTEVIGSNNISIPEGLFALAGLLALQKSRPILTALFAVMALSVRESAVVFPFIYILFAAFGDSELKKRRLMAAAFSLGAVAAMMALRFFVLKHSLQSSPEPWPVFSRVGMAAYMIVKTIFLPLPANLSIYHAPIPQLQHIIAGWLLIALALATIFALYAHLRRTGAYAPLLFVLAAALGVGPYMGVFALNILFAQHYLYVPLAFTIFGFAVFLDGKFTRGGRRILFAVLLTIFTVVSFGEAVTYRHDGTAFEDATRKYPASETAFRNLAYHQFNAGDFEGAEKSYRRVLKLSRGENKKAWNNLGDIFFQTGRIENAEQCFRKAAQEGEINLAVLLINTQRFDEAMPLLENLLADKPDDKMLQEMMRVVKNSTQK
jgi:protein O-mannosyl-transferase